MTTINNNIVQAHIHLRGIRPLLQHKFGPDALPLTPRERSGVAGNNPEEWRRTCMVDAHGRLYIDSTYIFAAVREGGRYIKSGRRTMLTAVAATLQVLDDPIYFSNRVWPGYAPESLTTASSALSVPSGKSAKSANANKRNKADNPAQPGTSANLANPFDPLTAVAPSQDPNQPVYLDIRGVKNPSTRARNVRYRITCAPGWELQFTISFDKSIVSREQMQSALWHAGKLIGIGNGRTIGMGRFDVVSFDTIAEKPQRSKRAKPKSPTSKNDEPKSNKVGSSSQASNKVGSSSQASDPAGSSSQVSNKARSSSQASNKAGSSQTASKTPEDHKPESNDSGRNSPQSEKPQRANSKSTTPKSDNLQGTTPKSDDPQSGSPKKGNPKSITSENNDLPVSYQIAQPGIDSEEKKLIDSTPRYTLTQDNSQRAASEIDSAASLITPAS